MKARGIMAIVLVVVLGVTAGIVIQIRLQIGKFNRTGQGVQQAPTAAEDRENPVPLTVDGNTGSQAARVEYNGQSFDTYVVDTSKTPVGIFYKDPNGNRFGSI